MSEAVPTDGGELRELYRELILDHARRPRHFGRLESPTHEAEGINPLCGDKLHLYLQVDNDMIRDVAFEGSGCAISLASASLLTDTIIGLDRKAAMAWFETVVGRLTDGASPREPDIGKLQALEGVREFPSRIKCATLAWHAMQAALDKRSDPATTE